MRLSQLQRYILKACYNKTGYRLNRAALLAFYGSAAVPRPELQAKIITKSLERLIDKELLIGYGLRTSQKWFIKEVRLTDLGLKITKKLVSRQLRLPIK